MSEFSEFEARVWQAMDRLDHKIDSMSVQMAAVREAQIRMEASDHSGLYKKLEAKLLALEAKVILLEANNAKQSGIVIALEWAYKLGPWVAITLFALKESFVGAV